MHWYIIFYDNKLRQLSINVLKCSVQIFFYSSDFFGFKKDYKIVE